MLDLDSLYGSGPFANPHLYDTVSHNTKLVLSPDGVDFARTVTADSSSGMALIGDPRNDENLLLNQLHLAFIKFHNQLVDALAAGEITDVFGDLFPPPLDPTPPPNASIEQLLSVRTYYDDLFAKASRSCAGTISGSSCMNTCRWSVAKTRWTELSSTGCRSMHPTVTRSSRSSSPSPHSVSCTPRSAPNTGLDKHSLLLFPLEFTDPLPPADERTDLRGGPVVEEFAADFTHFFAIDGSRRPQRAKRIEAKLNTRLLDLPPITDVPLEIARELRSLVVRNLLRSEIQELPSGQDIARKIGQTPLSDAELAPLDRFICGSTFSRKPSSSTGAPGSGQLVL
jgi:hypothetical protein